MNYFTNKTVKLKLYNNIIDASSIAILMKKICGFLVTDIKLKSNSEEIVTTFSLFGFTMYAFWSFVYLFCAYKAFDEDQTILRSLYDTRLRHYGDLLEKIVSTAFMSFVMCKIAFQFIISTEDVKNIMVIDGKLKELGVIIDYDKVARRLYRGCSAQLGAGLTRLFSVWILLSNLNMNVPIEILWQTSVADVVALILSAHYCYHLLLLTERQKFINDLLTEIRDRKSWEQIVLVRSKQATNMERVTQYQDKYVCQKIRACARVNGLLFKATEDIQVTYGFALACTLLFCLFYIILYLFYFMEATAGGLFNEMERYIYFVVFVFWQIAYTFGVIFLNIYFSESVVGEAMKTPYIVHEIVNADISAPITAEAINFSLQLLHQVPMFTACGLCKIDYMLLLQGARTITTFLVILLQFVMD